MNFRNTKLRQRQTRGELGGHFSQCEHPELFSSISWCLNCTLVIKIIKTVENTQYFSSIIITGTHYLPYLRRQKDELMSALFAGSKSGGEGFFSKSNRNQNVDETLQALPRLLLDLHCLGKRPTHQGTCGTLSELC